MSGRAHYGNAELKAGQRVAGPRASADVSRPRAIHAGFGSVGAAGTELDNLSVPRRVDDAGGFGRDQSFKRDRGQQERFRNLALDQRRADVHYRLPGIKDSAFRNGENISGEAERSQV